MTTKPFSTRCVLLKPEDRAIGERCLSLIVEHGWEPAVIEDPLLAMAELCVIERTESSRVAWGLDRAQQPALLVTTPADPESAQHLTLLLDAVRRYLPSASVWLYEEGELRKMPGSGAPQRAQPVVESAPAPTEPALGHMPATGGGSAPLRLTEPWELEPTASVEAADSVDENDDAEAVDDVDANRISREELDMLLGDVARRRPEEDVR